MTWDDLEYWKSNEWRTIQDRLDAFDLEGIWYNPDRYNIFASHFATPFDRVSVMIVGQDPYPSRSHATGIAFSIPSTVRVFPPTLKNIFKEYQDDLHYPAPTHGNLTKWTEQGVLLWNCSPTCFTGKPGTHNWPEWEPLTKEMVEVLSVMGVVFVFLGARARAFAKYVSAPSCAIELSHPSPLGARSKNNPFLSSRMFTRINKELVNLWSNPIDWNLETPNANRHEAGTPRSQNGQAH